MPLLVKGIVKEAEIILSPESRVASVPSKSFIVTPKDPDIEGTLVKTKFNSGGVARDGELCSFARLAALTFWVEGNVTSKTPLEIVGVFGVSGVLELDG